MRTKADNVLYIYIFSFGALDIRLAQGTLLQLRQQINSVNVHSANTVLVNNLSAHIT